MDLKNSQAMLKELIDDENSKLVGSLRQQRVLRGELEQAVKVFSISPMIKTRVPNSWHTFLDDTIQDMKQVTSHVYDGAMSKGLKHGLGQLVYPNG